MRTRAMIAAVSFVALAGLAKGDNWPQFRGPGGNGVSAEKSIPLRWDASENVAWKVEVPGIAWSSPVIWGDQVFLTTAIPDKKQEPAKPGLYMGGDRKSPRSHTYTWDVRSYDVKTGKERWKRVVHESKPSGPIHLKNTYASETPVTDGKTLVAYFGGLGVYAFSMEGEPLWKREDLPFHKMRLGWGYGSSPMIAGDLVYIQNDNEDKSYVVALDLKTGKQVWRADRDEYSSWSTPFLWKTPQRTELITAASKKVRAYDPATGKLLWDLAGMSSIAVPTPFAVGDLLIVGSGYVGDFVHRPIFAVRPNATGDISLGEKEDANKSIAWCQKKAGTYMPTPIAIGDRLYVLYDRGMMACLDVKTGKQIYAKERLNASGSAQFTASPIAYDGKILCVSEEGDAYVVDSSTSFRLLQKNTLGEMCMATPAVAQGSLFIRTLTHLYCIRAGGDKAVSLR